MIRHAISQATRGYTDITIQTVDSDVFVLAVAYVNLMVNHGATQVFVHHSKTNETCKYNILESSSMLGHDKSPSVFRRGNFRFGMPGLVAKMMS